MIKPEIFINECQCGARLEVPLDNEVESVRCMECGLTADVNEYGEITRFVEDHYTRMWGTMSHDDREAIR